MESELWNRSRLAASSACIGCNPTLVPSRSSMVSLEGTCRMLHLDLETQKGLWSRVSGPAGPNRLRRPGTG